MLSILGFLTIITFMVMIMTKRMSALIALITLPVIYGLIGGFGLKLAPMIVNGMKTVAPIAFMLFFAVLYFSIMIDVGLFDPVATKIVRLVKGDPVRVIVGTAVLATIVSTSGDATTTIMICITALLPIYKRLNINRIYLGAFIIMPNMVLNCSPWSGPLPRIMSSLKVDGAEVFNPLIPAMGLTLISIWVLAYIIGKREQMRLGVTHIEDHTINEMIAAFAVDEDNIKRPKRFWLNLILTILVIGVIIADKLPLLVVFPLGSALALLINYPNVKEQQQRIAANADNIIQVSGLVAAAGVFMGVMTGTKMADAMAQTLVSIIPQSWGSHMALITALLSGPGTFFLSNDAFYFGILPTLTQTAALYGISTAEMGRAGLLGQVLHGLSPLVAPLYLLMSMLEIDLGDFMPTGLLLYTIITVVFIAFSILTGAISL